MDKFVERENIRYLRDRLSTEVDPTRRALLHDLLVEEEDKLAADLALLREIELEIARGHKRIERQQALVAAMRWDGRELTTATALLNGLSATLLLYRDYRQRVLMRIEQNRLPT